MESKQAGHKIRRPFSFDRKEELSRKIYRGLFTGHNCAREMFSGKALLLCPATFNVWRWQ